MDNMPATATCQSRLTKQHLERLRDRIEDPIRDAEIRVILTHPATVGTVSCSLILNEIRGRSRSWSLRVS